MLSKLSLSNSVFLCAAYHGFLLAVFSVEN